MAESEPSGDTETTVSAHHTSPERVVFTEADNTDGWIASDLVVDLRA
jgi:hypothetical protein